MNEPRKGYQPGRIESRQYRRWEAAGYFKPSGQGKSYCIVIPPPNVTGTVHMGHAFQYTIMDALIRYHRMCGENTLWQMGTDHAGIATQMVVERLLDAEGRTRRELGRDAFVSRVWDWKEHSGSTISRQIRRLGASVDWTRDRFTMDPELCEAVTEVFVRLYEEGLIYRGKRLVNWDPVLHTAISDLEVLVAEETGKIWRFRYPLLDSDDYLVVATTRPETMLGDTAVAVHPDDERYGKYVGQEVLLPLAERRIPVIADDYVDPEFGTGCVKITPAHDFNDFEVGRRHGLEAIDIFDASAALNDAVPARFRGLDRFDARERVLEELRAEGLLDGVQEHRHMVPRGDRSGALVEPLLTEQWYVRAGPLAEPAIAAVEDGGIRFVPGTGPGPTSSGCAISRTGAFPASCGGATGSRPGTTAKGTFTWAEARRRPGRRTASARRSPCGRTTMSWTPGFHRRCGRFPRCAGPRDQGNWKRSIPPRCWSPDSTSSSSGWRG